MLDAAHAAMRLPGAALRPHAPVGFWGYSHQTYPEARELIDSELNDRGRQMLADVQNQCVNETKATYGFQRTEAFTRTGEPLAVVLARHRLAAELLDEQRIGNHTPEAPVLIQSGIHDDTVPTGQARQLADRWCAQGAAGRPAPTTCQVP